MLTETERCKRPWQAVISVTMCGGRGSLSPDLLCSPWCQVTICLHGIASAHKAVKCWQKPPCLFYEELKTLAIHLKSVSAPSNTTKAAEDGECSLWQFKAVTMSSQFSPITVKSLGKKTNFVFPEEDNRIPPLCLSCWCAIEVAALV